MLGLGTFKTMGVFVIENNRTKVVLKLANFNVFLSPLVCKKNICPLSGLLNRTSGDIRYVRNASPPANRERLIR